MGPAQAEAFTRPRSESTVANAFLPAVPVLTPTAIQSQLMRASMEALLLVAATAPSLFVRMLCNEKLASRATIERVAALKLISVIARKVSRVLGRG